MGHFVLHSLVSNSCPTLSWPHGLHNLPGSSVHGISQARILEWVAIPFSLGSSLPRDRTQVSCIGRRILHHWATREAPGETFGRFLSSEDGALMNGISALKNKNPSLQQTCSPLDWVGTSDEVRLQSIQLCCHPDLWLTAWKWSSQASYKISDLKLKKKKRIWKELTSVGNEQTGEMERKDLKI